MPGTDRTRRPGTLIAAAALACIALPQAAVAEPITPQTITGYAASVAVARGIPLNPLRGGGRSAAEGCECEEVDGAEAPRPAAKKPHRRSVR